MLVRLSLLIISSLALQLALPLGAEAKELEDRKWLQVSTANFEIHSLLSKKETRELAHHLEVFRAVAGVFTSAGATDSPIPTKIYALSGSKAARQLSLDSRYAGTFRMGLRRNWIVVQDTAGMSETSIIMHEYVHFLIRNFGTHNYPMWFHEGFAEYLSSMRIQSDEIIIGGVRPERARGFGYFDWIHLREVIARQPGDEWSRQRSYAFYSEAWALVHFLMNRTDQETRFNDQLMNYILELDAGADPLPSFESAFNVSVEKLDNDVRNYLSGRRVPGIALKSDTLVPAFEPEIKRMSREQASFALAQFALLKGEYERAERWYAIATEDPTLEARAEAGLGDTLKFRDRIEEALPHFERALGLAPDNPLIHLDMAEFWDYQAEQAEDPGQRDDFVDRARSNYVNAWQLNKGLPETYAMYGRTFLLKGDDYSKAVAMLEHAQSLLRSSTQIKLWLAQAYDGANRHNEAAAAAQSVLSWAHGESEAADAARVILGLAESETAEQSESTAETSQ